MDHRWISMCHRCLCLNSLTGCHGHAKKDFQYTICRKMFSRKIQGILDLRKNLIFAKNLRLQTSCQIKKMLDCFFILS